MGKLFQELKRRKVFRVAVAYAVVAWVLIQISNEVLPALQMPQWTVSFVTVFLLLGFPVALLLGWAFELTPDGVKADKGVQSGQPANYSTDQRVNYAILGLVLLVVGFQMSDRFLVGSAVLPNSAAYQADSSAAAKQVIRLSMNLGLMERSPTSGLRTDISISPDGYRIVYTELKENVSKLLVRELGELDSRLITELSSGSTGGAPRFSADGQWILFNDGFDLFKVPVLGGVPQLMQRNARFGSMTAEQTVLYSGGQERLLYRVLAKGGDPELLALENSGGQFFLHPESLPGGNAIIFTLSPNTGVLDGSQIILRNESTGISRVLIENAYNARYASSGHIVFMRAATLWAVPFDLEQLQTIGKEAPILEGLEHYAQMGISNYTFSAAGRLVYLSGIDTYQAQRLLVWVDREGRETALELEPQSYWHPRLSHDGEQLAVMVRQADNSRDIWVFDLGAGNALSRRTFSGQSRTPRWTPDDQKLVYSSEYKELLLIEADGTGTPELILSMADGANLMPSSFTPDGEQLVYFHSRPPFTVSTLSMDESHLQKSLIATASNDIFGMISPNGRWIAYISDESGALEIWVRPFPIIGDAKWQVSAGVGGGTEPEWAKNGEELFYRRSSDGAVMAVPVNIETVFSHEPPEVLFSNTYFFQGVSQYDVHPDGERFLMIKDLAQTSAELSSELTSLTVVENWFEELKRLAPPGPQ